MIKAWSLLVLTLFPFAFACAQVVPGTDVDLTPPPGFTPSARLNGFANQALGEAIMVMQLPAPYQQAIAGFADKAQLKAKGMVILSKTPVTIAGDQGLLLDITQAVNNKTVRKWFLAINHHGKLLGVIATYTSGEQRTELQKALMAIRYVKGSDPIKALGFSLEPVAPFKIAWTIGQNAILTPNGENQRQNQSDPVFMVGLSTTANYQVTDAKQEAVNHLNSIATLGDIHIEKVLPVTMAGQAGYQIFATAKDNKSQAPMFVYQVMTFNQQGYTLALGESAEKDRATYLPAFKKMVTSIKLKSQ